MYDKELYEKALEACELSHAPYSMIMVGAAALLEDGTVVKGANFENIASPTCICAEQSLICTLN
ncbi:MAG: cytidine deaminase, partial [Rikenellaceae bacterium]